MSRKLQAAVLGALVALMATSAVSIPQYPPLAPGYQRDFYDDQGRVVGRWVNDCDNEHFSQWGATTGRWKDSPTICL